MTKTIEKRHIVEINSEEVKKAICERFEKFTGYWLDTGCVELNFDTDDINDGCSASLVLKRYESFEEE